MRYSMRKTRKKLFSIILVTIFFTLSFSLQAEVARAFSIEAEVGEEGIKIEWDRGLRGKDTIEITPDNPWKKNILGLMYIKISINEITEDPPVVDTKFYFKLYYPYEFEQEIDLPISFGSFGIEASFFRRELAPVQDSNKIDISILSGLSKFQYDIKLDLGEIINDRWDGEATPSNNRITEEVVIDISGLPDLPLPPDVTVPEVIRLDITSILVFTIGRFTLTGVMLDIYGDDNLIISIPVDIPYLGILSALPIPLLKGSFHLWFNAES